MNVFPNEKPSFGSYLVGLYLFSVPIFSYSADLKLNIIPQIIGGILTFYAIYDLIKRRAIIKNKVLTYYLLFTLWNICSYLFADYQSQPDGLFTLIKVSIITISASIVIKNQSDYTLILSILFISVFITTWLNIEDLFFTRNSNAVNDIERFAGTFANANTAALYGLAIIWTGFTLLFYGNRSILIKVIIYFGIIIAGLIIFYSGSRKGFLGLIFFSLTIAWIFVKQYGYSSIKRFLSVLIAIGTIFVVINTIYHSPFFNRFQTMFQDESSSIARIYLFKEALQVWSSSIKNFIMGVGISNFKYYNNLMAYSHSTISETLVCSGIIGFGLYFAGLFSIISIFQKNYKEQLINTKVDIILIILFLLLILFFHLTAVMFDDRLFWPLLGIISSFGIRSRIHNTFLSEKKID